MLRVALWIGCKRQFNFDLKFWWFNKHMLKCCGLSVSLLCPPSLEMSHFSNLWLWWKMPVCFVKQSETSHSDGRHITIVSTMHADSAWRNPRWEKKVMTLTQGSLHTIRGTSKPRELGSPAKPDGVEPKLEPGKISSNPFWSTLQMLIWLGPYWHTYIV